jgi:hypothetical protein
VRGYRKSRRCRKDCRHRWRAGVALAEETQIPHRFNSPGGFRGDEASGIGGDGDRVR